MWTHVQLGIRANLFLQTKLPTFIFPTLRFFPLRRNHPGQWIALSLTRFEEGDDRFLFSGTSVTGELLCMTEKQLLHSTCRRRTIEPLPSCFLSNHAWPNSTELQFPPHAASEFYGGANPRKTLRFSKRPKGAVLGCVSHAGDLRNFGRGLFAALCCFKKSLSAFLTI